MGNKSNLVTTGCSVAGWDHSRSVLYGALESCSAQYQPLWIRRSHLISSQHKEVLWAGSFSLWTQELPPVPCWLQKTFMVLLMWFWEDVRSKAHSKGKVKGLPSTECRRQEILLLWGRGARHTSFQCSALLWNQHRLSILVFQASDEFVFVVLL